MIIRHNRNFHKFSNTPIVMRRRVLTPTNGRSRTNVMVANMVKNAFHTIGIVVVIRLVLSKTTRSSAMDVVATTHIAVSGSALACLASRKFVGARVGAAGEFAHGRND